MSHLIPEDGTGLANANSYVTLDFADEYFANHPFYADAWANLGEPDKDRLLVWATQALDSMFNWRGVIVTSSQALGWPRVGVVDHELRVISSSAVPLRVQQATCEMAFHLSKGDPFVSSSSAGLEALRIDVIELQFSKSTSVTPAPPATLTLLKGLGEYGFGRRSGRVLVG